MKKLFKNFLYVIEVGLFLVACNIFESLEDHNKDLAERNSRLEAENRRQREIVAALTAGTGESRKRVERIEGLAEEGRETINELLELLED